EEVLKAKDKTVYFLFALQDQSKLRGLSSLYEDTPDNSVTDQQKSDLRPVCIPREQLESTPLELDSDKKGSNESSRWEWNKSKSVISNRWAQMDRLEKWVVGGGLPILALVYLYLKYKK